MSYPADMRNMGKESQPTHSGSNKKSPLNFVQLRECVDAGAAEDTQHFRSKLEARTMTMHELRVICANDKRLRPILAEDDPYLAMAYALPGRCPPPALRRLNSSLTKETLIDSMLAAGWRP